VYQRAKPDMMVVAKPIEIRAYVQAAFHLHARKRRLLKLDFLFNVDAYGNFQSSATQAH